MRIILVGASGTIGKEIVKALKPKHQVLSASRGSGDFRVDLTDAESIRRLFSDAGRFDAVISAAGSAAWKPLPALTDEDFTDSLMNKLMGQVNVIRFGVENIADRGSITVTSGILARLPMPNSSAVSLVNAALEGFVRAAALEAPRGVRVNVVSPPWVSETLELMGQDPGTGTPAREVAQAYVRAVEGDETGKVIEVPSR